MRMLMMILTMSFVVAACANNGTWNPGSIHPSRIIGLHVSPTKYRDFTCREIDEELTVMYPRMLDLYRSLNGKSKHLIQSYPNTGGHKMEEQEYARVLGEETALHREWRRKLCRDRGPQTAQDIHDLGTGKAGKM